jgi:GR25 family glycosyltransferase involved in LPS biosynthesis
MKILNSIIIILIGFFFLFFLYPIKIKENFNKKINLPYPIYIINLEETIEGQERLPIIQNIYNNSIRFPATYGKNFDFTPYYDTVLTKYWDHGIWESKESFMIDMSDGEKGIIMSHYNLWKKIANEKEPHVILEDDAIGINANTQIILDQIIKTLPNDYDIYLLGFIDLEPINITNEHEKVKSFVLLHSYIITPIGAQKLLQQLPINMPVDSWLSSISDKINIYRHNYGNIGKKNRFYGRLICQKRKVKQIVNTNII